MLWLDIVDEALELFFGVDWRDLHRFRDCFHVVDVEELRRLGATA